MRLWNVLLDVIALTPEQLAKEQLLQRLPLIAALAAGAVIAAALIVHCRRK